MLLGAGPAAAATEIDHDTTLTIDPGAGAVAQDGKLRPTAPSSSCGSTKTVPDVDAGTFNITGLGEQSFINEAACLTIEYSTTDMQCQSDGLFSAAYAGGSFDNTAIQDQYAGDVGAAPTSTTAVSYSVNVPAGDGLAIVFNMSVVGAGCNAMDVKVKSDRPWLAFQLPLKGHPFVGETLSTFDTYWLGATSFTHQWRRCAADGTSCADIPGATGTTYVPVPDDVGHALKVHGTATDGVATSTGDSMPVLVGIQFDAAGAQAVSASDPTQTGRLNRGFPSSCTGPPKSVPSLGDAAHTRFYDVFHRTNASDGTVCTMVSIEYPQNCSAERPFSAAYLPSFDPATSVRTNYLADSGLNGTNGERTIRYTFGVPAGSPYDVVVTTSAAGATCP